MNSQDLTPKLSLLPLTSLAIGFLVAAAAAADPPPDGAETQPKANGLTSILHAVGKPVMPDLTGLIKPEKMGMLTDNQCRISDNALHLLSGIKVFSDIKLDIHIHVQNSGNRGVDLKAKKPAGKKKPRKGHKGKSDRKRQPRAKGPR